MSKFHNRYSPTFWPYRLSDNSSCLTTAAAWQQRLSDNSACLKILAVWHDRLSGNINRLITFIMPYVFNWKRKFMSTFEPGSVNQMASDHSSIIFGAKIEIGCTKLVEKTPIYIFSTFGSRTNEFEQEKLEKNQKNSKFQKPKSCRQLPNHLN